MKAVILAIFTFVVGSIILTRISLVVANLRDYVSNTIWGILAIVFAILSVFYFYVSMNTYRQNKLKDAIFDSMSNLFRKKDEANSSFNNIEYSRLSIKDSKIENNLTENKMSKELFKQSTELDLTSINMGEALKTLSKAINRPFPIVFKSWGNRRMQLDIERVYLINDLITATHNAGKSFLELQADVIFSDELLNAMVYKKREDFKMVLEKELADHKSYIRHKELDIAEREMSYKEREMSLNEREHALKMRELHVEAEQALMNAKTKEQEERANLLKEAIELIKQMPPVLQVPTITSIFGNASDNFTDSIFDEKIREFIAKKHKEEARTIKIENDELYRKYKENKEL